jgi:hypothetical protein
MKEPYEIYVDELLLEAKRRSAPSPDGLGHPRKLKNGQLDVAEQAAAEGVAYHLVERLRFRPEEDAEVVDAFRACGPFRERVRDVWTDYALRRNRRRENRGARHRFAVWAIRWRHAMGESRRAQGSQSSSATARNDWFPVSLANALLEAGSTQQFFPYEKNRDRYANVLW